MLLRAGLHAGESGRRAWHAWRESVGEPAQFLKDERLSVNRWLPLLWSGLQRNGVAVDAALLPYFRGARLREELRGKAVRDLCGTVLSALTAERIAVAVLKGAALAETAYESFALRHVHDIDLLLPEDDLQRAAHLLLARGFVAAAGGLHPRDSPVTVQHASGLPIQLHCRLFRVAYYRASLADTWARSRLQVIADVPVRILSPADMLLHVCGQAACCRGRESLLWVCDAWHVLARHPDLDWGAFLESAERSRLALPLWVMLRYLAQEMQAAIPADVVECLRQAAARTDTIGREVALLGARTGTRGSLRSLLRNTSGWYVRAFVVRWMLLPSPGYLLSTQPVRRTWLLPAYYVYRPLRYAARRARRLWRRRAR